MKIEKYSIMKRPWGNRGAALYAIDGNTCAPLIYLRKPKWVSQDQFDRILDALRLDMLSGSKL